MKLFQNFKTNFLVFCVLLRRDLKILLQNLKINIIDAMILGSLFTILYGYFFPALGMSLDLSLPLFLGIVINFLISSSYSKCIAIKSEVDFKKFFDYHLTLMISKYWLIFEYVVLFTIELIITTIPAFLLGITLLRNISYFNLNIGLLILIYFLSALFLSIFFLFMAFGVKWNWLINNTWERILSPTTHLGGVFFVWYRLQNAWPMLAKITLFSPVTYMTEGLRYAAIGPDNFIPIHKSIIVLIGSSLIMIIPLIFAMKRHLDPV